MNDQLKKFCKEIRPPDDHIELTKKLHPSNSPSHSQIVSNSPKIDSDQVDQEVPVRTNSGWSQVDEEEVQFCE